MHRPLTTIRLQCSRRASRVARAARVAIALAPLVAVPLVTAAPATALLRAARMGVLVRRPYPGGGAAPAMERAIRVTWPVRFHRQALDVAWCESSGDPSARNGQYRGHFQMGRAEWDRFGVGDPYDAEDNAAAAFRYFEAVGESWRPWQCQPVFS